MTMDQKLREASTSVRDARRQAAFTVQAPARNRLLHGGRVAFAAVAGVMLIVGFPLVALNGLSEPTDGAATPGSPVTATVGVDEPATATTESPTATAEGEDGLVDVASASIDLTQLEAMTAPPINGTEGFTLAASSDAVFASATIPNPDEWNERVWRSTDRGQTWEEVLALVDEGVGVDMIATDDEVVLLMSNHVGPGGASIQRSTDGGETWQRLDLAAPEGVDGIAVSRLVDGDETVILGTAWDGRESETFNDGAVVINTLDGYRGVSWTVADGRVGGPFDRGQLGRIADALDHEGTYFTVGEQTDEARTAAAWFSSDGIDWDTVVLPSLPDGWAVRGGFDTVTSSGSSLLIAGEVVRGPDGPSQEWGTALYVSTDGARWTLNMVDDMLVRPVAGISAGFVARAESPDPNSDSPVLVAVSTNGVNWEYEEIGIALSAGVSTDDAVYLAAIDRGTGGDTFRRLPLR